MRSISLYQKSKDMLKEITQESTYDKSINNLIDRVEEYMPVVVKEDDKRSPVKVNEETVERIRLFALSEGESIENILIRMMVVANMIQD